MLLANSMLKDFVGISQWQSLVAALVFIGLQIGFWFFLKHIKIKFVYRVLTGFGLGLVFGLAIQGIIGFLPNDYFTGTKDANGNVLIPAWSEENSKIFWVYELNNWAMFFKRIFINGITLLTVPIVFLAIFRVTSKPGQKGVGRISLKGVALLLTNVAFAFCVTFALGYFLNVGGGTTLVEDPNGVKANNEAYQAVVIPNLISGYFPSNMFATFAGTSIIPVMIIGALVGSSVKIISKRKPEKMQTLREGMDTAWDISMSILMTFMKFMPLAVMSMISVSVISRPIGALATLGKVIGIGYLGILISILWLVFIVFLSGMKVGPWIKAAWRPFLQGFTTQSSNATLPTTIDTMKTDLKINDVVSSTVGPLSTTMGLMACAGVQAGLATSILWTGTSADSVVHDLNIWVFFIMGLVVTLIASLGIAGIPGTATVVTVGVLGGLGFSMFTDAVLGVIAPLDGLFDMGRTGTNVLAAVAVAPIVAKSEGMIEDGSVLLSEKSILAQKKVLAIKDAKQTYIDNSVNVRRQYEKDVKAAGITKETIAQLSATKQEQLKNFKTSFVEARSNALASFKEEKNKMQSVKIKKTKDKK